VPGKIGYWRLVQASARVDVDCVCDVLCRFGVVDGRVDGFVLASWREEQTTIWSKSETPEERCEGLVEVDWCVANSNRATKTVQAGRIWHNCRQRHRWSW
jgi:hypothetical protein